jgi:hypothetical protein
MSGLLRTSYSIELILGKIGFGISKNSIFLDIYLLLFLVGRRGTNGKGKTLKL